MKQIESVGVLDRSGRPDDEDNESEQGLVLGSVGGEVGARQAVGGEEATVSTAPKGKKHSASGQTYLSEFKESLPCPSASVSFLRDTSSAGRAVGKLRISRNKVLQGTVLKCARLDD